uniref:SEFIR domain-containing protein n=1 Tax=Esox lucius TaxID=8010 RepID=A0AAY5KU06_ESOLU
MSLSSPPLSSTFPSLHLPCPQPVPLFTSPLLNLSLSSPPLSSTCPSLHLPSPQPVPLFTSPVLNLSLSSPPLSSTCPSLHLPSPQPVPLFTSPLLNLSLSSPPLSSTCPSLHLPSPQPVPLFTSPLLNLSLSSPPLSSTCPSLHLPCPQPVPLFTSPLLNLSLSSPPLSSPPLSSTSNCHDKGWLIHRDYTPSDPVNLEVGVDTREDEHGHLLPVLVARWKVKDDGSTHFLEGTLLHVLMEATNQYICVQYKFLNKITMRNPADEMWSFSLDRVVVEPGLSYVVSVSNLPQPNLYYSFSNIFKVVTVPGEIQRLHQMKLILWTPNTTLERSTAPHGRSILTVGFNADQQAQKYSITLDCSNDRHRHDVNQTWLSVQFDLDVWPRTCCYFDVEIQPFFDLCSNDCVRRRKTFNICGRFINRWYVHQQVVYLALEPGVHPPPAPPRVPPRVLVIYSQDHPLYRKIVLKLCAFLQAKCGTDVVLDLLDTAWLGTVGRLPWLEWQRQQISRSSDKILVLCSRGVQAKWQAMCGQGRVTLREDLRSPIDDMLTPALNLFLPDMLRAAALGKYVVAYFEDISSESDVPSVFDIAVKYKLMKNFEELCFRILNREKYAPGQVCHIEGIREDEYVHCQSGKELRDAIEAFQTFQQENPDWFEQECVDVEAEEEVVAVTEYDALLEQPTAPVVECVPEYRDGPPIYVCGVDVHEGCRGVQVLSAEVNLGNGRSVLELLPRVNSESPGVCLSYPFMKPLPGVTIPGLNPHTPERLACDLSDLASEPPLARGNCLKENGCQTPVDQSLPFETDQSQLSFTSIQVTPPVSVGKQIQYLPPQPEISYSHPVEVREGQSVVEAPEKRPVSGSDQGYISRNSIQQDSPIEESIEDTLMALTRLQQALYYNCP